MKRDVKKYIEEYNRKFMQKNLDKFSLSDIMQLWDIAKASHDPLWEGITSGLNFGFMVGYKLGKREAKAKGAKA